MVMFIDPAVAGGEEMGYLCGARNKDWYSDSGAWLTSKIASRLKDDLNITRNWISSSHCPVVAYLSCFLDNVMDSVPLVKL